MKIDGHTHVASDRYVPRAFFEGIAANMVEGMRTMGVVPSRQSVLDRILRQNQDHEGDLLIQEMDKSGVEHAVLLAPDFTYALESTWTISDIAQAHRNILNKHPGRLSILLGVDPRWGRDGVDLFERAVVEWGFRGLKLYPPCGYSPSDALLDPFYEICRAHGLPVLLHTGPTSPALSFEEAHPMLIDRAARRFPEVNFILAHGGVVNFEHVSQQCMYRPNVYCDISGFPALGALERWSSLLHERFHSGIGHKMIFGTDWPVFRGRESYSAVMAHFESEQGPLKGMRPREREFIMGGTIARLLGLPAERSPASSEASA